MNVHFVSSRDTTWADIPHEGMWLGHDDQLYIRVDEHTALVLGDNRVVTISIQDNQRIGLKTRITRIASITVEG